MTPRGRPSRPAPLDAEAWRWIVGGALLLAGGAALGAHFEWIRRALAALCLS
ncbi:MAG: hypothetical protein WD341_06270 [Tistlia sp.]|uniref:hypothetical protein n=1 Tax=Tistlia sp. TaxID=3057121 RepID=UPI0034A1B7C8